MNILLVDDHQIVRRGLKELLAETYPRAVFHEGEFLARGAGQAPFGGLGPRDPRHLPAPGLRP